MGDGFYRSKDPTNSIKVLKEKDVKENNPKNRKKQKLQICIHTKWYTNTAYTNNTASPLVYSNTGVTRGRLPQRAGLPGLNGGGAATAVPPQG